MIVFEDEVTPDGVRRVYDLFRRQTGLEPTMLFPGAGGYWWKLVHRDTVSAAFKRTATEDRPNVKFSNSPGKETIPGYVRVYVSDADTRDPRLWRIGFTRLELVRDDSTWRIATRLSRSVGAEDGARVLRSGL